MASKSLSNLYTRYKNLNNFEKLSIALIFIGVAIRIYHYIVNRSLWLDEALLSNNIISRDFAGLLTPLDDRQIAPIGFLFFQKLSLIIFGQNEYALRLFSLICGIASLPLFYAIIKRIANDKTAFLGLIFLVFGRYLLYYSHEAKQYNADLFIYLLIIYYIYLIDISELNYSKLIGIGILGAISVWFSHMAIIILGTLGLIVFIETLLKKDSKKIIKVLIPCTIWLISTLAVYFLFLNNNSNEEIQQSAFGSIGYFPPSPFTFSDIPWLYEITIHCIQYPLGTMSGIFILLLMLVGVFNLIKEKNYKVLLIGLPILIHLALSYFKLYPFYGRFILYTVVYSIILTVMGLKLIQSIKPPYGFIVSLVVSLAFMAMPIKNSLSPFYFEEIKSSMEYIESHHNEDDHLYVYSGAKYSYSFYQDKYNLPKNKHLGTVYKYVEGNLQKEFDNIKNKGINRTWFLYSHINPTDLNGFMKLMEQNGDIIDSFEFGGASAYCVEFH